MKQLPSIYIPQPEYDARHTELEECVRKAEEVLVSNRVWGKTEHRNLMARINTMRTQRHSDGLVRWSWTIVVPTSLLAGLLPHFIH